MKVIIDQLSNGTWLADALSTAGAGPDALGAALWRAWNITAAVSETQRKDGHESIGAVLQRADKCEGDWQIILDATSAAVPSLFVLKPDRQAGVRI